MYYLKLRKKNIDMFWDPTQPDGFDKKILQGQVGKFDSTPHLESVKSTAAFDQLTEKEYNEYQKKVAEEAKKSNVSTAINAKEASAEAKKILENAQKDAETIVEEANVTGQTIVEEAQKKAAELLEEAKTAGEKANPPAGK